MNVFALGVVVILAVLAVLLMETTNIEVEMLQFGLPMQSAPSERHYGPTVLPAQLTDSDARAGGSVEMPFEKDDGPMPTVHSCPKRRRPVMFGAGHVRCL